MPQITRTLSVSPFRRADRIANIEVSEIARISEAARAMAAAGQDIISLGTGEPDFPTPDHVCVAATAAMAAGQTRYTPTAGTEDLRLAIAADAGVKAQNVIISTGAKQVLSNLFLASLNSGDEVICPTPFWTSYRDIIKFSGGCLVEVACPSDQGFKITPQQLEAAITPATRWLLLNTPSNPSGAIYSLGELKVLAEVLRAHPDIWIASDEIYEHIAYTPFTSVRTAMPDLVDRIVVINGVSKAYSMTGWRIGWAIGPEPVIKAMSAVQGQSTSGTCSISQAAAVAALTGNQALITSRRAAFKSRRDRVVASINENPLLECILPEGAFYVFVSCEKALGQIAPGGSKIADDMTFCAYVLESVGLALIPGRAFSRKT
ncbi:MAG: pyridoxal phosphate-dependent aminotransferase [Rhodobacteraceae bacterium]|nr:pyridoxal phosphate-dependent aminotransferase [Paracoccaceae bacterium]